MLRDLQATADWLAADWLAADAADDGLLCRDPDDQKFIAAAIASQAAALVTGDQDLLVLKQLGVVPVVTPAQALKRCAVAG